MLFNDVMDKIESFFTEHLPGLTPDKLAEIKAALESHGFSELEHLEFLQPEDDLKDCLTTLQRRVLKKALQKIASATSTDPSPGPSQCQTPPLHQRQVCEQTPEEPSSPATTPLSAKQPQSNSRGRASSSPDVIDLSWAETFPIPWERCSDGLQEAVREKKIPCKKELLSFNRMLGDLIHKAKPRPGKKALSVIARRICQKYPESFQDYVPGFGTVLGDGTRTVLNRLVNYIDSKNRTAGSNSLRRQLYQLTEEEDVEDKDQKRKRKASSIYLRDSYGAVCWQPDSYPAGETADTQEEKRVWMVEEYTRDNQETNKVKELWANTYSSQRFAINKKDSVISQLCSDWPYLRQPIHLLSHFKTLMGFDLMERFDEQCGQKSEELLTYGKERGNKKTRTAVAELMSLRTSLEQEETVLAGVTWLLPHLFSEDQELLFKLAEDTVTSRHLEQTDKCAHPHIVIAGEHPFSNNCYVLVESVVLAAKAPYRKALAVMFAAYYVLNVAYPQEAAATLEFIQRMFAGINPDRGSKAASSKGKKIRPNPVNPKVASLIGHLRDFKTKWEM